MEKIFVLLVLFQIKHFIADYPLQGKYMLGKFKESGWVKPLLAHVAVHGFLTALIVIFFNYKLIIPLVLLDMVLHFVMDRIKVSSKLLGRFQALSKEQFKGLSEARALAFNAIEFFIDNHENKDIREESFRQVSEIDQKFKGNTYFWWALGLDQGVHHLTHYLIIYLLVS